MNYKDRAAVSLLYEQSIKHVNQTPLARATHICDNYTGINKLYMESTARIFVVYTVVRELGNRICPVDEDTIQASTLRDAIVKVIHDKLLDVVDYSSLDIYESVTRGVAVIEDNDTLGTFVISSKEIHPRDMTDMVIDSTVSSSFKRIDPEEIIKQYNYKKTATRDVDPDLGFDDLLDVL